jgi:hypothetical protein
VPFFIGALSLGLEGLTPLTPMHLSLEVEVFASTEVVRPIIRLGVVSIKIFDAFNCKGLLA